MFDVEGEGACFYRCANMHLSGKFIDDRAASHTLRLKVIDYMQAWFEAAKGKEFMELRKHIIEESCPLWGGQAGEGGGRGKVPTMGVSSGSPTTQAHIVA